MASGALAPAFPAVRIDGELYWDGGILSNTPTEAVFDDDPRKDSLIFAVHLWNPAGAEPTTMAEVLNRYKDVQYSSRMANQIVRQQQAHRLRHVINQLAARLPETERNSDAVRGIGHYGCQTCMHVVPLLAPQLDHETTPRALISAGPESGGAGMLATFTPRLCSSVRPGSENDPLSGVVLHENPHLRSMSGRIAATTGLRAEATVSYRWARCSEWIWEKVFCVPHTLIAALQFCTSLESG